MRGSWLAVLVSLAILCAGSATAAEIGLKGIEGRLGVVSISDDVGSTFGLNLGADLGKLTPDLRLEAGIDWWSKSWDVGDADWSWTNIAFLGNVRYDFAMESSIAPFAFGGVALCYQSWNWKIPGCHTSYLVDVCDLDDSSLEFGVDLGVGVDFSKNGSMIPTARAGYNANGGADYFFIQGGVRFPMK
jgi:hypothetical protein